MSDARSRLGGGVAVVLAGAFAAVILASAPGDQDFGYDLGAYLAAADRLVAGEPLYPAAPPDGLTPVGRNAYFYPPLVAAAFVPLAQLPAETARLAWFGLLIALAAAVGAWLVRAVPRDGRAWALAAYLAYLPLLSELRYGNLNLVTLALCLAAWRLRDRAPLAGAFLAAALGVKLLPLALVLFLLIAGRWRVVAWAAGIGLAVVGLSWPWLGTAWSDYAQVVGAIGLGVPAAGSNIVPGPLGEPPLRYLLPLVALAVAALAGLAARRSPRREGRAFATALAAAPLVATTVWYPYLVLAVPAILGSAGDRRETPPATRDPITAGTRLGAWLAIQTQLLALVRVVPIPLFGLLTAVAGGLRDAVRDGHAGVGDTSLAPAVPGGAGHILDSQEARRDAAPRSPDEDPGPTDAGRCADPVP